MIFGNAKSNSGNGATSSFEVSSLIIGDTSSSSIIGLISSSLDSSFSSIIGVTSSSTIGATTSSDSSIGTSSVGVFSSTTVSSSVANGFIGSVDVISSNGFVGITFSYSVGVSSTVP